MGTSVCLFNKLLAGVWAYCVGHTNGRTACLVYFLHHFCSYSCEQITILLFYFAFSLVKISQTSNHDAISTLLNFTEYIARKQVLVLVKGKLA